MNRELIEIRSYLFDKFHSCLDTAMKFDLVVEDHYKRCGNCKCKSKHPVSCGRSIKESNLRYMLGNKGDKQ
jgi:hypothetical protein